ncbi:MAG TPA: hypothetical protein VFB01_00840 [Burkholderiales bacterium]|nr:hypothetical protein [Burkholderiales bacterium]
MADIRRDDPRARRVALAVVAVAAVAGALAIAAVEHWRPELDAWLRRDPSSSSAALMLAALTAGLPALVAAAWLWAYGGRVARTAMYPAPGGALFRGTRVLTGPGAVRRGRLLQALAAVLWTTGVLLIAALWRFWTVVPAAPT